MSQATAYIGLGANLGPVEATLQSAIIAMARLPDTQLTGLSSLFRSAPLGPAGQSDYLNAVARLVTSLPPHQLLFALQEIETRHGRLRTERWGPRTLDLDMLLYRNDQISTRDLVVPHPELENRNFVLVPLLQIDPDARHPDGRQLSMLAAATDTAGLQELQASSPWPIDVSR